MSEKRRLLLVTVQKGLIWPEDELLLPKLDIDRLAPVGDLLGLHMTAMFYNEDDASLASLQSQKASGRSLTPEDPTDAAVHAARLLIEALFKHAQYNVRFLTPHTIPI